MADVIGPGGPARAVVDRHRDLAARARAVLDAVDGARAGVARVVAEHRGERVRSELSAIGIERLAELTDRNLRLRALADAGYRTALDVLEADVAELDRVPGVGIHTARSSRAAAEQLAEAVATGVRLRIAISGRGEGPSGEPGLGRTASLELLHLLHRLMRLEPEVAPHRVALTDYTSSVAALLPLAERASRTLSFFFRRGRSRAAALEAVAGLVRWEPWLGSTALPTTVARLEPLVRGPGPADPELRADFERRSVEYYTVLGEIVPVVHDVLAAHGMVPAELADRVAAHELDASLLDVRLRGYQAFGARFALNQGRVLLGDEMGLGKTVQAIAVMAHLAAQGQRHFLVVCPASVLVSWVREVGRHSALAAHRLHGRERAEAIERWLADGGVGVTTFEGLAHVPRPARDDGGRAGPEASGSTGTAVAEPTDTSGLGLLVVDEAHLVKNPDAQRSQRVAEWARTTWRVLLMTGTPMENHLEEFLTLVGMLQPQLLDRVPRHVGLAGADVFRHTMAPVYLRRNQVDVLVELPELVVVDEWEELTSAGEATYRDAVARGSFMAMRRAAWTTPDPGDSSKLARLLEIVEDATEGAHRVVVFSYFLDVLDVVTQALRGSDRGSVHGPITGSVPAARRQEIVDEFSAAPPGAVLVAQVQAGGLGLNVQAASVVVLCEPQLTPSTEAQAIARVHRMGQVRTVVVHRLLVEGGVDERVLELLEEKERLFDQYVRDSSVAAAVVRAVDVTERGLAAEVVAAEQARLGYGPVWDGLTDEADDDRGRSLR